MGRMLKIRILEKAPKCSLKCMLLLVTSVLFLFKDAKACDVLIFIDHDKVSTICLEESGCVDGMKSFTVKKGFDICIEDHLNDRVVMHVSNIIWRVRYEREYYIREDKICLNTTSITCSKDHPPLGSYSTPESRESFIAECRTRAVSNLSEVAKNQTFTVNTDYLSMSSSVWKMCACVNTYKLEEIGHLHTVLHQKTDPIPILEVEVKDALNNTQKITLSEHDQTFFLDVSKFKLKESGSIPFTVSSSLMQNWPKKLLLEYYGEFFYVDELSLRSYSERVSGDSITTAQGKTEDTKSNAIPVLYKKLDAECAVPDRTWYNCSCTCRKEINSIMMTPPITSLQCTKLAKDKSFYSQPKKFTLPASGFSVVDTYDETIQDGGTTFQYGHVVLGVGNILNTMEGRCTVRPVGSYGCFSCDDSAHVAIQATNIEKGGLVPFVSNCSFDRRTIKCDLEPTKLILREKHDVCYIKLLTKKRSELTIHIKYINFHGLNGTSPRQLKCEQNFPEQGMVNTVVSTRFLVTLMGAVTACFLLTMVSILFFRFVQSRHGSQHRVAEEPTLLEEL